MADLVRMVDLLVCSAEDALLLAGTASLRDAVGALTPAGPRPGVVCVTDAGPGAYLLRPWSCLPLVIPACPADVTDPTGAGRASPGPLAARLVLGTDPVSAARAAASVAAVTVTGWGPEGLLAVSPCAWAAADDPDVRRLDDARRCGGN